jgi:hypothetical protein
LLLKWYLSSLKILRGFWVISPLPCKETLSLSLKHLNCLMLIKSSELSFLVMVDSS